MSLVDPIADALVNLKNHENAAKKKCIIRPASRLLEKILGVMQENGYIESYERAEDGREGLIKVKLAGKINDCKAIKPRHAVKKDAFEKYEKRYLPSKAMGIILVSTSQGIITHRQAKERAIGGRLLAFVY